MDIINRGNENRSTSATLANSVSSRSHAVLQIKVVQNPKVILNQEPSTSGDSLSKS